MTTRIGPGNLTGPAAAIIIESMTTSSAHRHRQLRTWFRHPAGQAVLARERAWLDALLPDLFGYYLVEVGNPGCPDRLRATRVRHAFRMALGGSDWDPGALPTVHGEADALPFDSEAVDVLVLSHVLEFEEAPHAVLAEAERVLRPEGHLLVLNFNSASHWQLWRWLEPARGSQRPPWTGQFYSGNRLGRWLDELGFDTLRRASLMFRPPVQSNSWLARWRELEAWGERFLPAVGGVNVLLARKRVATITPLKPRGWPIRVGGRALAPRPLAGCRGEGCQRAGETLSCAPVPTIAQGVTRGR